MKNILCIFIISLLFICCERRDKDIFSIDEKLPIDTVYVIERHPNQISQSLLPVDTVFVVEKHN